MAHDTEADLIQHVAAALRAEQPQQSALSDDELHDYATRFVQVWLSYRAANQATASAMLGQAFAQRGVALRAITHAAATLSARTDHGADQHSDVLSDVLDGFVQATRQVAQQTTIKEMQATQQREDQLRAVIQELSTPIIPIYRGVLVLPLVGTIDSLRSQEITERLLEEIVRQQADMVIIDITGVSVVDTSVANHLIMTAQAVNLLGSRVIFTGISSTIAQTIVQLGVNLGDVITLSNLQAGMLYALEQLGLGITHLETA